MQKSMFNKYIKWRLEAFLKWKAKQKVQNEEILLSYYWCGIISNNNSLIDKII